MPSRPASPFTRLRRRSRPALAIAGAAMIGLGPQAAPASADGAYEPNETIQTATGPIVGGQDYVAALDTKQDVDTYAVNLAGVRQIDVSLTMSGCDDAYHGLTLRLVDADGKNVRDGFLSASNTTKHLGYSVPATGRYYLRIATNSNGTALKGCGYTFRVDPADAVLGDLPAPPPPAPAQPAPPAPTAPDTTAPVVLKRAFSFTRTGGAPANLTVRITSSEPGGIATRMYFRGTIVSTRSGNTAGTPKINRRVHTFTPAMRAEYLRLRRLGKVLVVPVEVVLADAAGNTSRKVFRLTFR